MILNHNMNATMEELAKEYEAGRDPVVSELTRSGLRASHIRWLRPETAAAKLLEKTFYRFGHLNMWEAWEQRPLPRELFDEQVVDIIMMFYGVRVVPHAYRSASADYSMLAISDRPRGSGEPDVYHADAFRLLDIVRLLRIGAVQRKRASASFMMVDSPAPDALWESTQRVMYGLYLEAVRRGQFLEAGAVAGPDGWYSGNGMVDAYTADEWRCLKRRKRPEDRAAEAAMAAVQAPDDAPGWDTGRWMLWRERL